MRSFVRGTATSKAAAGAIKNHSVRGTKLLDIRHGIISEEISGGEDNNPNNSTLPEIKRHTDNSIAHYGEKRATTLLEAESLKQSLRRM